MLISAFVVVVPAFFFMFSYSHSFYTNSLYRSLREFLEKKRLNISNGETKPNILKRNETSNRNNKLKKRSEFLHRNHLNGQVTLPETNFVFIDGEEREYSVKHDNKKRKMFQIYDRMDNDVQTGNKKQKSKDLEKSSKMDKKDEEDADDDENTVDPYKDVHIDRILAPVIKPEDAVKNPSTLNILLDKSLNNLAMQAVDIIEHEQNNNNKLTRLMEIFLGENSYNLKVSNLKLPDYNHELVNGETNEEKKYPDKSVLHHKNEQVFESSDDNGSINIMKEGEPVDPFFALPRFNIDQNDGIVNENSEDDQQVQEELDFINEIRQIIQIISLRNQEYIRSLTKIRMGLIRAERLKDQIYKWSKEMNGDYQK